MNDQSFGRLLAAVGEREGWQINPNGVQLAQPGGRRQLIGVELFDHEGESYVRLHTTIGTADGIEATRLEAALRINADLAHGALAIREGELLLVETHLLESLEERNLAAAVRYLAETGDFYERTLFRTDDH